MKQIRTSAGILLFRRRSDPDHESVRTEVLLVHPGGPFFAKKDEGAWTVPKGILENESESPLARAKKEFEEELGAELVVGAGGFLELGSVKQKGGKTVHAWAVEGDFTGPARSNTCRLEWPPKSGKWQTFPEIDRAEWFPLEAARAKINVAQREFLDRLLARLADG